MIPNRERIQKWVDALRSGDYRQGKGTLKDSGDRYCCLGVACEVSELGEWKAGPIRYAVPERLTSSTELPAAVVEWYGLDCSNPTLPPADPDDPLADKQQFASASWLNDTFGLTFEEIADRIEAKYLS